MLKKKLIYLCVSCNIMLCYTLNLFAMKKPNTNLNKIIIEIEPKKKKKTKRTQIHPYNIEHEKEDCFTKTNKETKIKFSDLPYEIIGEIYEYLDAHKHIVKLMLLNKRTKELVETYESNTLKRNFFKKSYKNRENYKHMIEFLENKKEWLNKKEKNKIILCEKNFSEREYFELNNEKDIGAFESYIESKLRAHKREKAIRKIDDCCSNCCWGKCLLPIGYTMMLLCLGAIPICIVIGVIGLIGLVIGLIIMAIILSL